MIFIYLFSYISIVFSITLPPQSSKLFLIVSAPFTHPHYMTPITNVVHCVYGIVSIVIGWIEVLELLQRKNETYIILCISAIGTATAAMAPIMLFHDWEKCRNKMRKKECANICFVFYAIHYDE